jgi:hypothetical protein
LLRKSALLQDQQFPVKAGSNTYYGWCAYCLASDRAKGVNVAVISYPIDRVFGLA